MFLYYKKMLLEREKQYDFFWNWYQQQQKQNKTNIWQNKIQYEFTEKHFKSNIFHDNHVEQYANNEYNKQNKYTENYVQNFYQKSEHKNQQKIAKNYQQQIQKQYEYQNKQIDKKQQQLQYQTTQQYEIQNQLQKRNETKKQNIWQKQYAKNQKNEYQHFLLQQNELKKQYISQNEKQKMSDLKQKTIQQFDFWKYYYDFLKYDTNDKQQYYFWNIENILKNQYETKTENTNYSDVYSDTKPEKQYIKKTMNNIAKQKQSIWQVENDIQKKEYHNTINTETIKNIVQNSLNEKQYQNQKIQYEQSEQKQNIDEETLFLHITEKLLEQRERSLRGNSFKI